MLGHGFRHGVASFDPLSDSVLIWTRWTPPVSAVTSEKLKASQAGPNGLPVQAVAAAQAAAAPPPAGDSPGSSPAADRRAEISLDWEVSEHRDFKSIVASGTFDTGSWRDWTVCVDVQGLKPCTRYYYRFSHPGSKLSSVVGRTKTLAAGRLDECIYGLVSCANWGFGCFHVYDLLSKVDDLDFVIHCGDYIYEYEKGYYPTKQQQGRHGLRPKHRCKTLGDYRERYACFRTDPSLQELHRTTPMMACWDDHEVSDSVWRTGAEDLEGMPAGEFNKLKYAAIQAYVEWVPVRGMSHDRLDLAGCHRSFHIGDLFTVLMVENRISCRDEPVDLSKTEFYKQTAKKDMSEWDEDAILRAKQELLGDLRDPNRKMIGKHQLENVRHAVQDSVTGNRKWQVLISQTVLSQLRAPRLQEVLDLQPKLLRRVSKAALRTAVNEKRAGKEGAELARMYLALGKYHLPMNPDAWDGYEAERDALLAALNQPGANPVVMAGDSHNAWAHELLDRDGRRLGVELDGPAVTSIGAFEDIYSRFEEKAGRLAKLFPLYLFTPWIEDAFKAANPDTLKFCNLDERGFVLCHVTRRRFHSEFHFVSTVKNEKYKHHCEAAFDTEAMQKGRLLPGVRYLTIEGSVPKRQHRKQVRLLRGLRDISASMHHGQPVNP